MAILRTRSRILPVDALIAAMGDVATKVGRIMVRGTDDVPAATCTAWYIAPEIVILPGFALLAHFGQAGGSKMPGPERILLIGAEGRNWTAAAAEPLEILGEDSQALAVMRVREPAPKRVLPLSFDIPAPGDPVYVFQFPGGRPDVCVSFGRILPAGDTDVRYDADTEGGSSGAPVLDSDLRVIGMHASAHWGEGRESRFNAGLPRALLLQILRSSRWWPDIAAHHKLADVAAAKAVLEDTVPEPDTPTPEPAPHDPILIRAAVSAHLNPTSLSAAQRESLREKVVNDAAERWTLRPAERQRILAEIGTIEALHRFRPPSTDRATEPLQWAINGILDGPPYALDDASEDELGWWLQAARWFAPVAKDLPKLTEIARALERRRIRGRLERIAGPGLQGRDPDLKFLREWYRAGAAPMLLTGIGGIGKSAVVARFASELPAGTLLLWLDFDRADLAPDDAVSVLAALVQQADLQVDGLAKPDFDETSWQDAARQLGERLAEKVGPSPPLLVLDSFEAAQYAERYQELWPVLEQLVLGLPQLRVCVTGRAPVPNLTLGGKAALPYRLAGLEDDDVRKWLRVRKVTQTSVVDRVVELARGIPLVLQLAFQLLDKGGKVEDLPDDLPERMIAGYLYDRILERVQEPAFKPLAKGLLVLRRLTLDMVTPVLGGLVKFPPGEPSSWFAELSREMGLVSGGTVLVPRTEVRSATLWLLERDSKDMVRAANERAAAWYAREGATAPEDAAELVYHRLRLGDIKGAAEAWRDGCGAFLTYAADDMRDPAARDWLLQRLGTAAGERQPLDMWEQDAAERIRAARARGLDRAVSEILGERFGRSLESPLIFHDAYQLTLAGHADKAAHLLDGHDLFRRTAIARDRVVLRALLASRAGDRRMADQLLATIDDEETWSDRPAGDTDALAVIAARIRLTVDIDSEMARLAQANEHWQGLKAALAPADVVTPALRDQLRGSGTGLESTPDVVPLDKRFDGTRLLEAVERDRRQSLRGESEHSRAWRSRLMEEWKRTGGWTDRAPYEAYSALGPIVGRDVLDLAERGWRRWSLAARGPFLQPAYALCLRRSSSSSPVASSILGTLALFAAPLGTFVLGDPDLPLQDVMRKFSPSRGDIVIPTEAWPKIRRLLTLNVDPAQDWQSFIKAEREDHLVIRGDDLLNYQTPRRRFADYGPFLVYLFAPDPLQTLVEDLAGVRSSPPQRA